MRPVYSVVPTDSMDEIIAPSLKGYRNDGPVRVGNAAAQQTQHDTFGSIILAAMPMFLTGGCPAGKRRLIPPAGIARSPGGKAGVHARRGHLGISRPQPRSYLFRRNVLGRLQSPGRDRHAARLARSRYILGGDGKQHPEYFARAGLEREAQGLHRRRSVRRPRRQRSAPARDRTDRAGRSAFHSTVAAVRRVSTRETRDALCKCRTTSGCRKLRS